MGIEVISFKMEKGTAEAIRPIFVSNLVKLLSFLCLLAASAPSIFADPVAELASFSVFDKVDLNALASEPTVSHGPPMSGSLISTQSCFVVAAPPARVAEVMRSMNPARYSELKVMIHSDLSSSASPANFSRLSSAPDNSAVRSLVTATQKGSTDLQISKEEAKKLPVGATGGGSMPAPVANFWAEVLAGRARAFSSGGSATQPPYDHTGRAVRPSEEFNGMLRQQDKVRKQFAGLIDAAGIGRGGGSLKPQLFWELLSADDQGVVTLGASYSRPSSQGSYQAADVLYYASGGYFVALTLHQMWPVDVGGKPSSLIWRGDLISSAAIAGLHGIERLGSESSMMRDVSKSVKAFRRDIGGSR